MKSVRAGSIHNGFAMDCTLIGHHARHAAIVDEELSDGSVGQVTHAQTPALRAIGHGEVIWLQITIARTPQDRFGAVKIHSRPFLARQFVVDEINLQPGLVRDVFQSFKLLDSLVGERYTQRSDLTPARIVLRILLQVRESFDRPHGEFDSLDGGAHLADKPGGLRRSYRRQRRFLLDQQHVRLASLGEVVSYAAPNGAAADHDNLCALDFVHGWGRKTIRLARNDLLIPRSKRRSLEIASSSSSPEGAQSQYSRRRWEIDP